MKVFQTKKKMKKKKQMITERHVIKHPFYLPQSCFISDSNLEHYWIIRTMYMHKYVHDPK